MGSMDALINEIAHGVLESIKPYLQRQSNQVISEDELMKTLGVKDKGTMAAYRKRGLKSHRIDYKHRVYFWEDVEDFIKSESCEW